MYSLKSTHALKELVDLVCDLCTDEPQSVEAKNAQDLEKRRVSVEEQQPGSIGFFDTLPEELIMHIFSFLEVQDVCNLSRTCTRLRNVRISL